MVGLAVGSLGAGGWKWALLVADPAAVPGTAALVTGSCCGETSYPPAASGVEGKNTSSVTHSRDSWMEGTKNSTMVEDGSDFLAILSAAGVPWALHQNGAVGLGLGDSSAAQGLRTGTCTVRRAFFQLVSCLNASRQEMYFF